MAAAESGSVDCFHDVVRAIRERGSEDKVRERERDEERNWEGEGEAFQAHGEDLSCYRRGGHEVGWEAGTGVPKCCACFHF